VVDRLTYEPMKLSFEECLKIARQSRPELKISSLKAEQAGKLVRISQSEYFPAVSVIGNYGRFGDHASVHGSDYKDAESWYVMAVANWNFWEWGRTKFRVDAAGQRKPGDCGVQRVKRPGRSGNKKRLPDAAGSGKPNFRIAETD